MTPITDRRQAMIIFDRHGPVIHHRDADGCGVPRGLILRLTARGELIRLGKSAFVQTESWESADEWVRFRYRSIAFGLGAAADTYLTGPAAAVLLDLPVLGDPPDRPTALRPGDPHIGHDRTPFGTVRHGFLPLVHRTMRARVRTVSPAFAAVDIARHLGPMDGLMITDAVLHGGVPRWSLQTLAASMLAYPGMQTARWVIEHADSRAESPLESLGRYSFLSHGQPAPLSNVWIRTEGGWYRVDHLVPETGAILEGDGALKFNNRSDADAVVKNQWQREQHLRTARYGIGRYSWADALGRPWIIPKKADQAAAERRPGPVPTDWTLDAPRGSTR